MKNSIEKIRKILSFGFCNLSKIQKRSRLTEITDNDFRAATNPWRNSFFQ